MELNTWNQTSSVAYGGVWHGVDYEPGEHIFHQGDPCDCVRLIISGTVMLSIVSSAGKEAVVGMMGAGSYIGEESLVGSDAYLETATAMTETTTRAIDKDEMRHLLHTEPGVIDQFIAQIVSRTTRLEADLADQLMNMSEQRLARTLCLLASDDERRVPRNISQQMLASIVGTTRSRINVLLGRFKQRGLIEFDDGIKINCNMQSLLQRDS